MSQPTATIADYEGSKDQGSIDECCRCRRRCYHRHVDDRTRRFRKQRLGGGTASRPVEAFLRLQTYPRVLIKMYLYVTFYNRLAMRDTNGIIHVEIPIQSYTNINRLLPIKS